MRSILLTIIFVLFVSPVLARKVDPLFAVTLNGKQGFINKAGKVVIEPRFLGCSYQPRFVDGLAVACTKDNDKAGFIDKTGNFVIGQKFSDARPFSEGLAVVYFGEYSMHRGYDKAGFIDKTGKLIVEPVFDNVKDFSEGLAAVSKYGKSGFIDKTGKIVIPLQFDYAFSFSEGLAVVYINEKYGFIDKTGKIVIEPQFTRAHSFSEEMACVKIGGTSERPYPNWVNQEWEIIGKLNRKYGYINKKGEVIYSFWANDAGRFSDGFAAIETLDGYGFINHKGKFTIQPKFSSVFGGTPHFSEGLLLTVLKDKKIGFINKKGTIVIKTEYKYAYDFENGLAQVCEQIRDTCGYIDKTGKVIWEPTK